MLPEDLTINKDDRFWVEHYVEILAAGYQLRAQYRPGWKPSVSKQVLPDSKDQFTLCPGVRFPFVSSDLQTIDSNLV